MSKNIDLIKPYFSENRDAIMFGLASLIIVDMLQLIIPRVIKWAVDDLTSFQIDAAGLFTYALYIVILAVFIGIFRYFWRLCLIGASRRIEEGLRNKLFRHLQTLSPAYFAKTKTGELMAHATNDIHHIRMATGMGMVALNDAVILGAAAVCFMAYINVRLTFFVLIPMPLIVIGTKVLTKKLHRSYKDVQAVFSELTETARERFAGIRIIKAYGREEESLSAFGKKSEKYIDKNLRLIKIVGIFFPMMVFFSNMSLAIVLYLGGRETILSTITPGDFVAFISYLGILTWPMMALGWVMNLIQRGRASLDRINVIMETRPDIDDIPGAKVLDEFNEALSFENVSFSYEGSKTPALSGIDLAIEKGKTLGIVGPPGAGKSTLLGLAPRLFDATGGRFLIDREDIGNFTLKSVRSAISFTPQEPFLFQGTIRENIAFTNEAEFDSKVLRAAEKAGLRETIESFPNGLDTIVGEKGVVLSGGQKQRIALARALMEDAGILILDDPVSQVDTETGNYIIDNIAGLSGKRTILIASHRLSALRFADHIITLDEGKIVESGTHAELLEREGYYARTFRLQEIAEEVPE